MWVGWLVGWLVGWWVGGWVWTWSGQLACDHQLERKLMILVCFSWFVIGIITVLPEKNLHA
jgi:hypothetical protein